ncbi:MAG: hypothetical protein WC729_29940 [Sphingomonas sp.]|jgi:hypothetical protein|uniref:hypothetical protein n=1 Tax=Sphingomonas sp. TaxID=28214 RepID=UPI00356A41EB
MIRMRQDGPNRCAQHATQEQLSLMSVRVAERRLEVGVFTMYGMYEITGFYCCVDGAKECAKMLLREIRESDDPHLQFSVRL